MSESRQVIQGARQTDPFVGAGGERLCMHHPWRTFRDLADWTLIWAPLPFGVWGLTNFRTKTVTLAPGMTQVQRRCTIAHETQHVIRGPVARHHQAREERVVDRNAARLLLPDISAVGEALAWSQNEDEAADCLWVDRYTLRARLDALHPSERAYLKRRLEDL